MPSVVFTPLPGSSDERGLSFALLGDTLAAMDKILDVHLASIAPGAVRGNHYHSVKTELITVVYRDAWSFHWDSGEHTEVRSRKFDGVGAVSVEVPRGWSHAVRNDGGEDVWLFNTSDRAFDPEQPSDSHPRIIVG